MGCLLSLKYQTPLISLWMNLSPRTVKVPTAQALLGALGGGSVVTRLQSGNRGLMSGFAWRGDSLRQW